ncbi:MAG: class I SAM-dependent methyltransferase [Nitrospirota bacterium]
MKTIQNKLKGYDEVIDISGPKSSMENKQKIMLSIDEVQGYWDQYTVEIQSQFTDKKIGSREYFQDIKKYHDEAYTLSNQVINLPSLEGKSVLEIGCGIGLDALEYARNGARVTAIDLSPICVELTKKYFAYNNLKGTIEVQNAEYLPYEDESFDVVIARQVLMFTPDPHRAVDEMFRVLKPGGRTVALLHNRHSWYALLARITRTNLIAEAKDPPVNKLHSIREVKEMFNKFSSSIKICLDKFPTETNRRTGIFAQLYNHIFVPLIKIIPEGIIRHFGWYIIVIAIK